jgi:LPXTG-site transpeptidase (sortase) family protein
MNRQNIMTILGKIVRSTLLAWIAIFVFAAFSTAEPMAVLEGPPTRLAIPTIALDTSVAPVGIRLFEINGQPYGTWNVRDDEVGWHNLSANLGHTGNTVLSGHSDIKAKVFQRLSQVEVGDEIVAFTNDQPHYYVVIEKTLVQEKGVPLETRIKNAQLIAPTQDERLTLVTCANAGATHRLIVIAQPKDG